MAEVDVEVHVTGLDGLSADGSETDPGEEPSPLQDWINLAVRDELEVYKAGETSAEGAVARIRAVCGMADRSLAAAIPDWGNDHEGVAIGNPIRGHYFVDWSIPTDYHLGEYIITWHARAKGSAEVRHFDMAFRISDRDLSET